MNSRNINPSELDILFYEELTQLQLSHIFNIIFILSEYMLMTTDMLMSIYEKKYKEKMGLSYLKKAVKEKLIIEYQYDLDEDSEKKIFYYALKSSTYNYLRQNQIPFLKLPPYAAHKEKSRLLTFNKYIIQEDYTPNIIIPLDFAFRFFVANPNVVCYFPDLISITEIQYEMRKKKVESETCFETIDIPNVDVGKYTRAVNPKDID